MKNHGQYCPIAKAVDVLGERWSILVMRELLLGSTRFNDIARGLPGMSRTMLSKRLRELESGGLVDKLDGEYLLTAAGRELRPVVFGMGQWGEKWLLRDPDPGELEPVSLLWHAHARLDTSVLPDRRVVIAFELDDRPERFWIVVENVGCSVCDADPGFAVDVVVRAPVMTLYRVWYNQQPIVDAVRGGRAAIRGRRGPHPANAGRARPEQPGRPRSLGVVGPSGVVDRRLISRRAGCSRPASRGPRRPARR